MNTLEAIAARRSIWRFKVGPIPDPDLHEILRAGSLNPLTRMPAQRMTRRRAETLHQ